MIVMVMKLKKKEQYTGSSKTAMDVRMKGFVGVDCWMLTVKVIRIEWSEHVDI